MASKFNYASIRDFARDPSIRQKALDADEPIMLINKRSKGGKREVFFVLPEKLFEKWYEMYEDWRDAQLVKEAMEEDDGEEMDWEDLKRELDNKFKK